MVNLSRLIFTPVSWGWRGFSAGKVIYSLALFFCFAYFATNATAIDRCKDHQNNDPHISPISSAHYFAFGLIGVTVGSLAYSIVANTQQFTAGVVASRAELRTLKDAFIASQSPTERYSAAIDHLTQQAAKFPAKAEVINAAIGKMRNEMAKAEFDASRFGQVWNKIGLNIDPVAAGMRIGSAAFGMLKQGVNSVIEQIESLNQLSHRSDLLGVSERQLVGLSEAAEKLSGIDLPQFESAFTKMIANIATAAMDPESGPAKALERLGLNAKSLSGLGGFDQLMAVADAMQQVQNAGERLALSKTIAGKGGAELASTLASGGDAIRRIADEEIAASKIDFVRIDEIKEAHSAMDDLGDSINGAMNIAASEFSPVVNEIAQNFSNMIGDGDRLRGTIGNLANATQGWLDGVILVGQSPIWSWLSENSGIMQDIVNPLMNTPTRGILEGPSEKYADLRAGTLGDKNTQAEVEASKEAAAKAQEESNKNRDATARRIEAFEKANKEIVDSVEYEAKLDQEKLEKSRKLGQDVQRMMDEVNREIQAAGEKITEGLKLPAEKLRDDLFALQESFRLGAITPWARERGLADLKMKADEMAGRDVGARSIGLVRGGSVEALRQQFGGGNTERQLAEQKKTAENTTVANKLLEDIKTAISANALKEAV